MSEPRSERRISGPRVDATHRGDGSHGPQMASPPAGRDRWRGVSGPLALTVLILLAGMVPLPQGTLKALRQSAQSMELNRADREATAGSYYEGLIDGGPSDSRSELTRRLLGESPDWVRFHDIEAHFDVEGDFLQFELHPNFDHIVFGSRFTTNAHGLRDRDYSVRKPKGTYRILLLGSSIDMGWGVSTETTYENQLERWLNRRAALLGISRRFEVLNLAVAAYSPMHRLERFRRLGGCFEPDLVIYSATMLDPKLLELHLANVLRDRIDPPDRFVTEAFARAGITNADLARDADEELIRRETVKKKLGAVLWPMIDQTLAALRAECDRIGAPLVYQIVPRVGKADAPDVRAEPVARHRRIAASHADWTVDLTPTFDDIDQTKLEISPWDDHPNARGHQLLFEALAHAIADDPSLYWTIFGVGP